MGDMIKMKYAIVLLAAGLGLAGCAKFDEYVDRGTQCVLLDVAKQAAAAKGWEVDQYLKTENLFVCGEVEANKVVVAE